MSVSEENLCSFDWVIPHITAATSAGSAAVTMKHNAP